MIDSPRTGYHSEHYNDHQHRTWPPIKWKDKFNVHVLWISQVHPFFAERTYTKGAEGSGAWWFKGIVTNREQFIDVLGGSVGKVELLQVDLCLILARGGRERAILKQGSRERKRGKRRQGSRAVKLQNLSSCVSRPCLVPVPFRLERLASNSY